MSEHKEPHLDQENPLTEEDIRWLISQMDSITGTQNRGLGQVIARFTLEQIRAIRTFERSSGKLTSWLLFFTVVLVLFTAANVWLTIVLVYKSGG